MKDKYTPLLLSTAGKALVLLGSASLLAAGIYGVVNVSATSPTWTWYGILFARLPLFRRDECCTAGRSVPWITAQVYSIAGLVPSEEKKKVFLADWASPGAPLTDSNCACSFQWVV